MQSNSLTSFQERGLVPNIPSFEFRQKVNVCFERGPYRVATIHSATQLLEVQTLRYEVFGKEFQGRRARTGTDCDALDLEADHLAISEISTNKIVGTYRLISSQFSNRFYSSSEFNIDSVLGLQSGLLELSRACIQKEYRTGIILALLWRGISEYLSEVDARYLFGCASVRTLDPSVVLDVSAELIKKQAVLTEFKIEPRPEYNRASGIRLRNTTKENTLPSLFQAYLNAGAKVSLLPAWDYSFKCVDFFTILNTEKMTRLFEKRYKK